MPTLPPITADDLERVLFHVFTEPAAIDVLADVIDVDPDENDDVHPDVVTYSDFGLLTLDNGVVLKFPDGQEFTLTIQKRRG